MANDVFIPPTMPNPADRTIHKPIYIVISEDPIDPSKLEYYQSIKIDRFEQRIVVRGYRISAAQAKSLGKDPNAKIKAATEVEVEIPWQKVKRIDNITYKKAQKETK